MKRRATHAGSWYEKDKKKLNQQLEQWLTTATEEISMKSLLPAGSSGEARRLVAVIGPHAGYSYSGETASYAYSRIRNEKNDIKYV